MQKLVPENEQWISREITEDVHFGDFEVSGGIFRATSYNDYIARIVARIADKLNAPVDTVSKFKRATVMPAMSINRAHLAQVTDAYIRTKLFGREIDPHNIEDWKVLRVTNVIDHITSQISGLITEAQEETAVEDNTKVMFTPLSSVDKITVRESYALDITKSIYELTPYPSNKGQYECDFLKFADNDGAVDAVAKIIENRHTFVRFRYVRDDGLPHQYIPDFFVRFGDEVFIVETKAQDQVSHDNVVRKQKAAVRWTERINSLPAEKREGLTWHYAIVGHATFYDWKNKNMSLRDILNYCELRNESDATWSGKLF